MAAISSGRSGLSASNRSHHASWHRAATTTTIIDRDTRIASRDQLSRIVTGATTEMSGGIPDGTSGVTAARTVKKAQTRLAQEGPLNL
jgi:hypothetical protein